MVASHSTCEHLVHSLLNSTGAQHSTIDDCAWIITIFIRNQSHCTPFHLTFLSLLITPKAPSLLPLPIITLPLTLSTSQRPLRFRGLLVGSFSYCSVHLSRAPFNSRINQFFTRWEPPDKNLQDDIENCHFFCSWEQEHGVYFFTFSSSRLSYESFWPSGIDVWNSAPFGLI